MFCDIVVEIGGRVDICVADVWMDECDESSATGYAVLTHNCISAKVWCCVAGSEFGLLNTGDENVVLGEEVR